MKTLAPLHLLLPVQFYEQCFHRRLFYSDELSVSLDIDLVLDGLMDGGLFYHLHRLGGLVLRLRIRHGEARSQLLLLLPRIGTPPPYVGVPLSATTRLLLLIHRLHRLLHHVLGLRFRWLLDLPLPCFLLLILSCLILILRAPANQEEG